MTTTKSHDEEYRELVAALPDDLHDTLDDLVGKIESERDEALESLATVRDEAAGDVRCRDSALETIERWLHDAVYFGRSPVSAREMMQLVEGALGR